MRVMSRRRVRNSWVGLGGSHGGVIGLQREEMLKMRLEAQAMSIHSTNTYLGLYVYQALF